ncbi:MAG: tyrosine-type recombinase/integrase [Miniphocaeibacter sp.]|jgi:integrase|uniref:tyrosine-type recombinase/integrase n=1 Tax=Miniphocaeibacter sp. TaxID=3100973 RepID=UPI0017AAFB76|nr:tyrosine-type recombinase/integrase [Gallicola sp.]
MLTLTKFHIDEENGIFRHGIKTDAGKDRVLPIHPRIMPFFKERMKSKSEYIFPFPKQIRKMSVDYYRKYIYYKLLEELGIQKLSPHQCRHTFSSLLNRNVSNKEYISRLMGHTDYSLTANVYTHTEIEELKKAIKSIE